MSPIEKILLLFVLPTVLISSVLEAIVLSRRQRYDWRAMGASLFNLTGRTLITVLLPLSIATPAIEFMWEHRLTTMPLDTWQAIVVLFFSQEFCYYWFHRASHRVRWFWCNHSVHHTPNQLNLSAAYRFGMFGKLIGNSIFFVPVVWLGFSPTVVLTTVTLNLLYQFWLHATWIPKLGWFEYIFNTPSAHRVHHAANLEYLDANYGGVLIVFDRLFGTYIEERKDVPCRYGLVDPITTNNPLRIEFAQWISLLKDLLRARSIKAVLGYLTMPPGWNPDGNSNTTEDMRRRARGVNLKPT